MRLRRVRSFTEACILGGCLMIVLFSLAQVFLLNNRAQPSRTDTSTLEKLSKASLREETKPQPQTQPDIGVIRQRDALKRALSSPVSSASKARLLARSRAQQEVRELERSLVKLMRENSRTPDQSVAELKTELYARRVGRIIQQVAQEATQLANTFKVPVQFSQDNPFSQSNELGVIASQRRAFSDVSLLEYGNRSHAALVPHFPSHENFPVPSYVHDVSSKHHQMASSRKNEGGDFRVTSQQISRTIESLKSADDFNPPNTGTEGSMSLTLAHPNTNLTFKEKNSLSDHASMISESVQGLSRRQPNRGVLCPKEPSYLVGNGTDVNLTMPLDIDDIMAEHADVLEGGEWMPKDCVSRHRVAFVIPYRDRWGHLKSLLYYLIPLLKRQQIHFRMFVVEQFGNDTFNKGRIMNAAFREALKLFDFQCVTFHDVDLVPEDDRNMYSCAEMPKHMSIGIDKFNYRLPYEGLVGGVLMFRTEHFQQVNGYSNMYWGWGAEDDDMTTRILHQGLRIYRPPSNIARYKMVKHDGRKVSEVSVRMKLLRSAARRSKMEGLNNINYNLLYTHTEKLFTHFLVDIGHP